MTPAKTPRDENGRFLAVFCHDPNCDGSLELDNEFRHGWRWICTGLTHDTDTGPLRPCSRSYPASRSAI